MLADPVPVFFDIAGIHHQQVFVVAHAVHQQIVDDAPLAIGLTAVLHLAGRKFRSIVGGDILNQVERVWAFE